MGTLLLLIALSQSDVASPRVWTIYLDEKPQSRLLRSEIERDWTTPQAPDVTMSVVTLNMLRSMNARRKAVQRVTRLVSRLDGPPEIRWLPKYPVIRFGNYERVTVIDNRAFATSGHALATVETYIANGIADTAQWQRDCDQSRRKWEAAQVSRIHEWMITVGEGYCRDAGTDFCWWSLPELENRYSAWDGYPQYEAETTPPFPMRKFPWER